MFLTELEKWRRIIRRVRRHNHKIRPERLWFLSYNVLLPVGAILNVCHAAFQARN